MSVPSPLSYTYVMGELRDYPQNIMGWSNFWSGLSCLYQLLRPSVAGIRAAGSSVTAQMAGWVLEESKGPLK